MAIPSPKRAEIPRRRLRMRHQRHRREILGPRPDHLDPRGPPVRRDHHLPAHQRRRMRHPRHRRQPRRQLVVVGDQPRRRAVRVRLGGVVDRHMRVGAEDAVGELLAEPDHHRLHHDERRHPEHHADQRIPGDHRDPALPPPRPQVAPGDLPLEGGEGRRAGRHGLRSSRFRRADPVQAARARSSGKAGGIPPDLAPFAALAPAVPPPLPPAAAARWLPARRVGRIGRRGGQSGLCGGIRLRGGRPQRRPTAQPNATPGADPERGE